MYRIAYKKDLNEQVTLMKIEAPLIAKKARPGQFIIFRIDEYGERVPLTIADTDPEAGTVTIIFQKVGLSTNLLGSMNAGESILDFVGPPPIWTALRRPQLSEAAWAVPLPIPLPRHCIRPGQKWI